MDSLLMLQCGMESFFPLVLVISNTKLHTDLIFKLGQDQAVLMSYLWAFQQTCKQNKLSSSFTVVSSEQSIMLRKQYQQCGGTASFFGVSPQTFILLFTHVPRSRGWMTRV